MSAGYALIIMAAATGNIAAGTMDKGSPFKEISVYKGAINREMRTFDCEWMKCKGKVCRNEE